MSSREGVRREGASDPEIVVNHRPAERTFVLHHYGRGIFLLRIDIASTGTAFGEPFFAVQSEQVDGSTRFRGHADNPFPFVSQVLRPDQRPRIKQRTN